MADKINVKVEIIEEPEEDSSSWSTPSSDCVIVKNELIINDYNEDEFQHDHQPVDCNNTAISNHQQDQLLLTTTLTEDGGIITSTSSSHSNFVCQICNLGFARKPNLRKHERIHKKEEDDTSSSRSLFPCPQCDLVFNKSLKLKQHSRFHTGELPFICEICHMRFAWKPYLTRHYKMTHPGDTPPEQGNKIPCPSCPESFARKADLLRHGTIHTGKRPYVCETCDKSFNQRASLNKHVERKHEKIIHSMGDKCSRPTATVYVPVQFPFTSFTLKADILQHGIIHQGERPYVCETNCNKSFKQKTALTKHVELNHKKIDNSRDKIPCTSCSASFASKGDLIWHKRRIHGDVEVKHRNIIPYPTVPLQHVCQICNMAFVQWQQLQQHVLITHVPKFQCKICHQGFEESDRFMNHQCAQKQSASDNRACHAAHVSVLL